MDVFDWDVEKLARFFVDNGGKYYRLGVEFFKNYSHILPKGMSSRGIELLNEGIQIAKKSDVYVFSVFDSWADSEYVAGGNGYHLFRKIGDSLEREIYREHPNQFEEILTYLVKNKVGVVFTFTLPGGKELFGLSSEGGDGDYFEYNSLVSEDVEKLSKSGIETIALDI